MNVEYEEVPENAPDHLKMAADLERYMEEEGIGEYGEEISSFFEENLVEAANSAAFSAHPVVAIAAAYKASTGATTEKAIEKFGVESYVDSENSKKTLEQTFRGLNFNGEHRNKESVSGKNLAQGLHNELEPEMSREKVGELYKSLID